MTKKKRNIDIPRPLAFALTAIIVLLLPLPFALYLGGIDWITQGSQAGLKEFIAAYLLGLGILIVGLVVTIIKDRRKGGSHKH